MILRNKKLKETTLMTIITLFDTLVNALIEAEEKFFDNPRDFYSLEKSVKSSTDEFAANFLGTLLTSVNEQISKSVWRMGKYNIQRTDSRTIILGCTWYS
jgi:hypothetical protein